MQGFELTVGEERAPAAAAAVGEEGDVAIAQAEDIGGFLRAVVVLDVDDLALAEVVATSVGAELSDFVAEDFGGLSGADEAIEAGAQSVGGTVVAGVEGVFAAGRPLGGDSDFGEDARGSTFDDDALAEFDIDVAGFWRVT